MKKGGAVSRFSVNKRRILPMRGQNRGQVTIFIIIAILIVGLVALVFFIIPKTSTGTTFDAENPHGFLQTCLEDPLTEIVDTVSSQGGSLEPEHYILYQDDKIKYLCYTDKYWKLCSAQQSLLGQYIVSEIEGDIEDEVKTCFANLVENYRIDGYAVNLQTGSTNVELLPKRVVVSFDGYVLNVSKAEAARYDGFNVVLNNNLYELTSIANSIIDWESREGDAETTVYMSYYKDLKVEKKTQQDGTTIYILTDRNTEKKFQFASRSNAPSPDYGLAGISPA